jgi:hypothetical protein
MKDIYKRVWFEVEIDSAFNFPPGTRFGYGITAFDLMIQLKFQMIKYSLQ